MFFQPPLLGLWVFFQVHAHNESDEGEADGAPDAVHDLTRRRVPCTCTLYAGVLRRGDTACNDGAMDSDDAQPNAVHQATQQQQQQQWLRILNFSFVYCLLVLISRQQQQEQEQEQEQLG